MHFFYSWRRNVALILTMALLAVAGCDNNKSDKSQDEYYAETPTGTPIEGQYIIVLKPNLSKSTAQMATEMAATYQLENEFVYGTVLSGFAAKVPAERLNELKNDSRVKYIEPDRIISLGKGKPGGGGGGASQQTPWGITRVGGAGDGTGKTAWIIDTGIDLDHPDLNVDVNRSVSFISNESADDLNGHGTHVSGTIAAINNSRDVVGVAAGATVVAVKVLNRRGSGSTSGVIAGIDYVGANGQAGDAANMSLGGSVSQALDDAVVAASSKVKFALAAGNESDNANNHSPARANGPNIYTVSAISSNDAFASFSNYGNPPVDFAAPGVSILSLWKSGGTNTISGTSMATPHVCGLLLLGAIHTDGFAIGDPDGNADPIAHR